MKLKRPHGLEMQDKGILVSKFSLRFEAKCAARNINIKFSASEGLWKAFKLRNNLTLRKINYSRNKVVMYLIEIIKPYLQCLLALRSIYIQKRYTILTKRGFSGRLEANRHSTIKELQESKL